MVEVSRWIYIFNKLQACLSFSKVLNYWMGAFYKFSDKVFNDVIVQLNF